MDKNNTTAGMPGILCMPWQCWSVLAVFTHNSGNAWTIVCAFAVLEVYS